MPRVAALAVLTTVTLLGFVGSVRAGGHTNHGAAPLRILVTNDDGWRGAGGADTPLIVALRDALQAAGHNVTVVAPDTDQSGTGTRFTFGRPLVLGNPGAAVWTVSGSPADSVLLGTNVLFRSAAPDLVVSGINPGGNYSSLAIHSGTVGAALSALDLHIPAIAVSVDGTPAQSLAAKDAAARYTTRLIAALAAKAHGRPLLPDGVGLNVNYPGATKPTGARLTFQDPNSYIGWSYTNTTGALGQPGIYTQVFGAPSATPAPGSDWKAIVDGKISLTPIDANLTAHFPPLARLWHLTTVTP